MHSLNGLDGLWVVVQLVVVFNSKDVAVHCMGQAFADEIFWAFDLQHPETEVHDSNTNSEFRRMIDCARSDGQDEPSIPTTLGDALLP